MEIPQFLYQTYQIKVLKGDSMFKPLKEFPLQIAAFWGKCILFAASVLLTALLMLLNSEKIDP